MTPEGKVKDLIKKWLKAQGAWYFMPIKAGGNGVPDFVCCINGKLVAIEAKRPGRRGEKDRGCSALQVMQMDNIKKAGGLAVVVDGEEDLRLVEVLLDRITANSKEIKYNDCTPYK